MPPSTKIFAAAKCSAKSPMPKKSHFRNHTPISQVVSQLQNHPLAHECHFAALHPHFAIAKWAMKLALSYEMGCENTSWLRKWHLVAKSPLGCEMGCKNVHCLRNHLQATKLTCEMKGGLRNHLQASKWLRNDLQDSKWL